MKPLPELKFPRPKQYRRNTWHSGKLYTENQPFTTFSQNSNARVALAKMAQSLIKEPENARALEIGPGNAPILNSVKCMEKIFLDSSHAIANTLKTGKKGDSQFVVGHMRELPFNQKTFFDTIIASEVLTHIIPSERLAVVNELAQRANSLLIVEREKASLANVKKAFVQSVQLMIGKKINIPEPTDAKARKPRSYLVDLKPVIEFLEEKGWQVELIKKPGETVIGYNILKAWKIQ